MKKHEKKNYFQLKEDLFLPHTQRLWMLSDKPHLYALSQQHGWWQAGDPQEGCRLPSHQHRCLWFSRHGDLPREHPTAGQDICGIKAMLPSSLQDGAGAREPSSSSPLHGKGFLLIRRGESPPVTREIIRRSVLLPSHIWRKREGKQARGGNLRHPQGCEETGTTITTTAAFPWEGFTQDGHHFLQRCWRKRFTLRWPAPCESEAPPDLLRAPELLLRTHGKRRHGGETVDAFGSCSRRAVSSQAADFASLASSHIAGHSCADRARASYPNNQLGEMVSKPERGWGAPAEHRDRQLTRAVKIRDRKRQNHAFPLRLQAQRSRTSSSPKLAGE